MLPYELFDTTVDIANSDRLAFAITIAPIAFSRVMASASVEVTLSARQAHPAVVASPARLMLSFAMTGMPCRMLRGPVAARSASRAAASAMAVGFVAMMDSSAASGSRGSSPAARS